MPRTSFLPRTVIVFGFVSFLNDAASEMVIPLLPLFLTVTLGAGPMVVGLIEGLADATASFLKLVSGRLVDRGWQPKKLVLGGYGLSNIVRPLIGFAFSWGWVLFMRFFDRIGKGLRTTPRDALVALAVDTNQRGRAFGFHRAMDHAGAMLGPLLAFVLLQMGLEIEEVFFASVIPGVVVMALLWWGVPEHPPMRPEVKAPALAWKSLDHRVRALVLAAGGLAFASVPDVFLVLWASNQGIAVVWIPLLWAIAHGLRSLVANYGGILSDRWGRMPIVLVGWACRVFMLLLLALAPGYAMVIVPLFLLYAATTAFTEGAERALIGDFAPLGQKATAFGWYHMLSGLMVLPGAVLFGGVWQWVNMPTAFILSAVLTTIAVVVLIQLSRAKPQ